MSETLCVWEARALAAEAELEKWRALGADLKRAHEAVDRLNAALGAKSATLDQRHKALREYAAALHRVRTALNDQRALLADQKKLLADAKRLTDEARVLMQRRDVARGAMADQMAAKLTDLERQINEGEEWKNGEGEA